MNMDVTTTCQFTQRQKIKNFHSLKRLPPEDSRFVLHRERLNIQGRYENILASVREIQRYVSIEFMPLEA